MLFNQVSNEYDDWLENPLGRFMFEEEVDLMKSLLTIKPGMRILDVGCGTGNFMVELAGEDCQVVGVDTSDGMLNVAREKMKDMTNVDFKQMDVSALDFEDETFDVVVALTSFEFMEDKQSAFNEMWRVLKNGGQLVIGTISSSGSWGQLYTSSEFKNDPIYSKAEFINLSELTGFKNEYVSSFGGSLFITPETTVEDLSDETETELPMSKEAGFIAAAWLKENFMTCQLSFYALNTENTTAEIEQILELIEKSDLEYEIGTMSTFLRGPSNLVFDLVHDIHQLSQISGYNYAMNVTFSNECGC